MKMRVNIIRYSSTTLMLILVSCTQNIDFTESQKVSMLNQILSEYAEKINENSDFARNEISLVENNEVPQFLKDVRKIAKEGVDFTTLSDYIGGSSGKTEEEGKKKKGGKLQRNGEGQGQQQVEENQTQYSGKSQEGQRQKQLEQNQTQYPGKPQEEEEHHTEQDEDGQHKDTEESHKTDESHEAHESHLEPLRVLFPWFVQAVGLVVFYVLSKYINGVPYTAVMFVIGTLMGVGSMNFRETNQLDTSVEEWAWMNHEVLLLVFLPGLLFRDALNVNFHSFLGALSQILLFAFPMVLAGTYLTALVAYYIFPYGWPWYVCLTLGSILSATDPVAVAALLNEVGAPPRLKLHIAGESLFNDGAAIVFFNIFAAMFYSEYHIPGFHKITVGEGFVIFLRMALGGVAVGIAFAIGLVGILFLLDAKFNTENNVVQVAATVTTAYLAFYTAEMICGMSGVLSVVVCGILTRALGGVFINDTKMMESFWILLEHLLNTLLFTLGGVIFGLVASNQSMNDGVREFYGADWGYLILLYIFVQIIRFFLFFVFYPITVRIGLKTNWQETVFMSYGGLRGAVGIALAINLDNHVFESTKDRDIRDISTKLFGMVGGIALLTLIINGTTSGPLISALGLTKTKKTRQGILKNYRRMLREIIKHEYAQLMLDARFAPASSYLVVSKYVPILSDMTRREAESAVMKLYSEREKQGFTTAPETSSVSDPIELEIATETKEEKEDQDFDDEQDIESYAIEFRHIFIESLRAAYDKELELGILDGRESGGLTYNLLMDSLENAADDVNQGKGLNDWDYCSNSYANHFYPGKTWRGILMMFCGKDEADELRFQKCRHIVLRTIAFIRAHEYAQEQFKNTSGASQQMLQRKEFQQLFEEILNESKNEVKEAVDFLSSIDKTDVETVMAHHSAIILLNKAAIYVSKHLDAGMLSEKEAEHFREEIDEAIHEINHSDMHVAASKPTDYGDDGESGRDGGGGDVGTGKGRSIFRKKSKYHQGSMH